MIKSNSAASYLAAGVTAAALFVASSAALAEAEKPPVNISIAAEYLAPSDNRDADFGFGFFGTVGIPFSDVTELEINTFLGTVERASDEEHDWQYSLGADLLFGTHFDTFWTKGFRPFLLGGVGVMLEDSKGDVDAVPYVNFGGGTLIRLTKNGLALRLDTRMIQSFSNPAGIRKDTLTEFRSGIGIEIPLNPRPMKAVEPVSLDRDGDGVPDYSDRCPGTTFGEPVNEQGCPMQPSLQQTQQRYPAQPAYQQPRYRQQSAPGVPVGDEDGDGVPDSSDNCPRTSRSFMVDARGCIVGYQKDAAARRAPIVASQSTTNTRSAVAPRPIVAPIRGSTSSNTTYRTSTTTSYRPTVAARATSSTSNPGCLGAKAGVSANGQSCAQPGDSYTLNDVNFAAGTFTLSAKAKAGLTGLLEWLQQQSSRVIEVRGSADKVDGSEKQKDLAVNRAVEIKSNLMSKGIAADRVAVTGRNANTLTVITVLK